MCMCKSVRPIDCWHFTLNLLQFIFADGWSNRYERIRVNRFDTFSFLNCFWWWLSHPTIKQNYVPYCRKRKKPYVRRTHTQIIRWTPRNKIKRNETMCPWNVFFFFLSHFFVCIGIWLVLLFDIIKPKWKKHTQKNEEKKLRGAYAIVYIEHRTFMTWDNDDKPL